MKTQVILLLQQTPQQYNDMVLNLWMSWCQNTTQSDLSWQRAMISKPLFNWWQLELVKLESQFLQEIDPFSEVVCKVTAKDLYDDYVMKIMNRYSKPLIKKANEPITVTNQN